MRDMHILELCCMAPRMMYTQKLRASRSRVCMTNYRNMQSWILCKDALTHVCIDCFYYHLYCTCNNNSNHSVQTQNVWSFPAIIRMMLTKCNNDLCDTAQLDSTYQLLTSLIPKLRRFPIRFVCPGLKKQNEHKKSGPKHKVRLDIETRINTAAEICSDSANNQKTSSFYT